MCTSLSQHCHYHCYLSAVTVSTATLLSAPSLPQRCTRVRCLNAVHIGVNPLWDFSRVSQEIVTEAQILEARRKRRSKSRKVLSFLPSRQFCLRVCYHCFRPSASPSDRSRSGRFDWANRLEKV